MKELNYDLSIIEDSYNVHRGFFCNDKVIVDNELMNDISMAWDYTTGKICVSGFLMGDKLNIFVAEGDDFKEFKGAVINKLDSIISSGKKLYSFNRFMEMGNFEGYFAYKVNIDEIKPFNARGWNKDRFFNALIYEGVVQKVVIKDIFGGDGGKSVKYWKLFVKTGNSQFLMDIVSHNINCLLKESIILKNKQWFLDDYEVDNNNFMLRKKHKGVSENGKS